MAAIGAQDAAPPASPGTEPSVAAKPPASATPNPKRAKKAAAAPVTVTAESASKPGGTAPSGPAVAPSPGAAPAASIAKVATVAEAPKPSLAAAPTEDEPLRVQATPGDGGRARGWTRPAAWGAGAVATGFLVLAIQQGFTARSAYADADAMVGPGGALAPGSDPARHQALVDDGNAARRNAYVSAGLAVVFGAAAGYLGWKSADRPGPALAFRF